jgi:hypothetical protein
MTRADSDQVKVHYKGSEDDFVVMAESIDAVKRWKEDKSTPLVDVVNSFDVFTTHKYVDPSSLPTLLAYSSTLALVTIIPQKA